VAQLDTLHYLPNEAKEIYLQFKKKILQASGYHQLLELHETMPDYIRHCFMQVDIPGSVSCHYISYWHDLIMQKVIQLVEEQVIKKINQPIPAYSWILFGSGGREEPTFWTDQDNGLVYSYLGNVKPTVVDGWFLQIAERVVQGLQKVGYPLCEGNVMATNKRWRGPIEKWFNQFNSWARDPVSQNHRFLMIAADLRHLYGSREITQKLHQHLIRIILDYPEVLIKAAEFNSHLLIPLGIFNQWYKERYGEHAGTINIKQSGYLQLVGALRILNCKYALPNSSTAARIQLLSEKVPTIKVQTEKIKASLDLFLSLRLQQHVVNQLNGKKPGDYIDPRHLNKKIEKEWKTAIKCVRWLQQEAVRQARE
jgi:CBS domain-containing protein